MPPAASWLPLLLSHIGSQVKRRQSQSYKFKEFAKISNFWILKLTLHATHLLKLLDKMYKYEMDLTSIVEDTERTPFCPQTDRQTDKVKPVYLPFNFDEAGGIKIHVYIDYRKSHTYTVMVLKNCAKYLQVQWASNFQALQVLSNVYRSYIRI